MASEIADGAGVPSYQEFAVNAGTAFVFYWNKLKPGDMSPFNWGRTYSKQGSVNTGDVVAVVIFSVVWTILRQLLAGKVFKAFARWSGVGAKEELKMPECLWKLLFSVIAWLYSAYLVLIKYDMFYDPRRAVSDWKPHTVVAWDLYGAYMLQITFYIHSIYASLVLDEWRKDTNIMLTHHVVTISLLATAYIFRYDRYGVFVLFFHDVSDIFLQLTKLAVYYKSKGGAWKSICDVLSTVGFVLFAVTWYLFRLYWFPLKAIYASTHLASKTYLEEVPPCFFYNNVLLIVLLVMHIYWFMFIVEAAIKVVFGKSGNVEDVREYDEETDKNSKTDDFDDKKKTK